MPTKAKLHFQPTSAGSKARVCEEAAAPETLAALRLLAWQRFEVWWQCGGLLPDELDVFVLQWSSGGREKTAEPLYTEEQYQVALRQARTWCEFKVSGSSSGSRWDLLWPDSKTTCSMLSSYKERAEILASFAGLDREELQWMRGLPRGHDSGPLVDIIIAGRENAGKSLIAAALLGRPNLFPDSRFSFTQHVSGARYDDSVRAMLMRAGMTPLREWQRQLDLNDLLLLYGYQDDSLDRASSSETGIHDFEGAADVRPTPGDVLTMKLPHPLLQAGLTVVEQPAAMHESGEPVERISTDRSDGFATRVLLWCIDIHGRLDAEFRGLLRAVQCYPGSPIMIVLTKCGECSGAELKLEAALIKEAARIAKACIPELPAENIMAVSAKIAMERAAAGEEPPESWRGMVERLSAVLAYQLNMRLTNNWSVDVASDMEAICSRPDALSQNILKNTYLDRLSPMVGIKASLVKATQGLQQQILERLETSLESRRSAVLGLELDEDNSVLEPSAEWFSEHREVYLREVKAAIENDNDFVASVAELVAEVNADLQARLGRTATDFEREEIDPSVIWTDTDAFMVAVDILYSEGFRGVTQRSWSNFFESVGTNAAQEGLSRLNSLNLVGSAIESKIQDVQIPHKKDWLFNRLEAEALAAIKAGMESRRVSALKGAEARYDKLRRDYLDDLHHRRQALFERFRHHHAGVGMALRSVT